MHIHASAVDLHACIANAMQMGHFESLLKIPPNVNLDQCCEVCASVNIN